jgi:transposase
MAYPTILRERALEALRKGHTKKEVNEMFGLGKNTLKNWEELEKETGALEKRPLNRKPSKIVRKALIEYYKNNPDASEADAAVHFKCHKSGIYHAKKACKLTYKKRLYST